MSRNEINLIIKRLRDIHVQQSDLLQQLEELSSAGGDVIPASVTRPSLGTVTPGRITTRHPNQFKIGDQVNIKNPKGSQQHTGIVVKVSDSLFTTANSRVQVRTQNGDTVSRAPKNLILIQAHT